MSQLRDRIHAKITTWLESFGPPMTDKQLKQLAFELTGEVMEELPGN